MTSASTRFVAFLDVLGFSGRVCESWEETVDAYQALMGELDVLREVGRPQILGAEKMSQLREFLDGAAIERLQQGWQATIRLISDSIVIVGPNLIGVTLAAQFVQQRAALAGFLVRGGLAYGRHLDFESEVHVPTVSEALIRAVAAERRQPFPRVILDDSVVALRSSFDPSSDLNSLLLFGDGFWFVNPFSPMWGCSMLGHVEQVRDLYSNAETRPRYDWLLDLGDSLRSE